MKNIGILSVFIITMAFAGFAAAEDRSEVPHWSPGAQDAVAVVVHPLNPARMLTTAQLREIFTRKVLGWHRVGGPHELSIRPIIGRVDSPSREAFRQRILSGREFQECEMMEGDDRILHAVAGDEAAIGVVSLSTALRRKGIRILAVDGEKASLDNPKYPLSQP